MHRTATRHRWAAILAVQTLALTALALSAGAQVTLYGAAHASCGNEGSGSSASTLYTVDPATGVATAVGPIADPVSELPFTGVTGMAFLSDGRLVASAHDDDVLVERGVIIEPARRAILIEIDPSSGAASLIGEIGNDVDSCGRTPDITWDPTSSALYGLGDYCGGEGDYFLTIDPDTGEGTPADDPTGTFDGGNGLAWQPSTGTIFHTPGDSSELYTVDPDTGESTAIEGTSDDRDRINALDFHPLTGVLYGSTTASSLVTLDTTDGSTTVVGDFRDAGDEPIDCFDALAFRGPAGCPSAPEGSCRDDEPHGSKLRFKAKKGKQSYKWEGYAQRSEFGDPKDGGTDYRVCTFDASGGNPLIVLGQAVPSGEGWKNTSKGFKYKSKAGSDGITRLVLRKGEVNGRIKATGKDVPVTLPFSDDESVVTQVLNSDGVCWNSTFPAPAKKNDADRFKAKD